MRLGTSRTPRVTSVSHCDAIAGFRRRPQKRKPHRRRRGSVLPGTMIRLPVLLLLPKRMVLGEMREFGMTAVVPGFHFGHPSSTHRGPVSVDGAQDRVGPGRECDRRHVGGGGAGECRYSHGSSLAAPALMSSPRVRTPISQSARDQEYEFSPRVEPVERELGVQLLDERQNYAHSEAPCGAQLKSSG
jgi:hypothetical protein